MYDFLNAIGGMGFAILGAALTVGLLSLIHISEPTRPGII